MYWFDMQWLNKINDAINYIEANLMESIDMQAVAREAYCSESYFSRMFSFITGISLSEYIRRRRLSLAGYELKKSDIKIIDLALKYGYDSPYSFTRAFQAIHGVTPSEFRTSNAELKTFPRITFDSPVNENPELTYRIEQKEAFEVFGIYEIISRQSGKKTVPDFIKQCVENDTIARINNLLGKPCDSLLSAAIFDSNNYEFKYMMCQYVPKNADIPAEYTRLKVPELTWAIFLEPYCELQKLWTRIYSEWFPSSQYEQIKGVPGFEIYYGYGYSFISYAISEIWIPVKLRDN